MKYPLQNTELDREDAIERIAAPLLMRAACRCELFAIIMLIDSHTDHNGDTGNARIDQLLNACEVPHDHYLRQPHEFGHTS